MDLDLMTVSLRDFKKGIQDLKEELAHLTKGSEEYNRVAKEVRDAQSQLKSQMEGLKDTYQAAEGSYDYWVVKIDTIGISITFKPEHGNQEELVYISWSMYCELTSLFD